MSDWRVTPDYNYVADPPSRLVWFLFGAVTGIALASLIWTWPI